MRFEVVIFFVISFSKSFQNFLNSDEQWIRFIVKYNKSYNNIKEERYRKKIFLKNLREIDAHNVQFHKHLETYEKGVNIFTDMEFDEFKRTYLGFNGTPLVYEQLNMSFHENSKRRSTNYFNWAEKGAVTQVKMQGRCNSCYAFSAIGSIEAQLFIHYNKLVELSAQQIVDCSTSSGNTGCNSGFIHKTFHYVIKNGIESEADYPYVGAKNDCSFSPNKIATKLRHYVRIPPGDETLLLEAVSRFGPMAAAMEVTPNTHQFVGKTILYDRLCNSHNALVNHAVLIVGYGSVNGSDYWLIKNSWGFSFGDNGYAKISRNRGNHCKITNEVYFPILDLTLKNYK